MKKTSAKRGISLVLTLVVLVGVFTVAGTMTARAATAGNVTINSITLSYGVDGKVAFSAAVTGTNLQEYKLHVQSRPSGGSWTTRKTIQLGKSGGNIGYTLVSGFTNGKQYEFRTLVVHQNMSAWKTWSASKTVTVKALSNGVTQFGYTYYTKAGVGTLKKAHGDQLSKNGITASKLVTSAVVGKMTDAAVATCAGIASGGVATALMVGWEISKLPGTLQDVYSWGKVSHATLAHAVAYIQCHKMESKNKSWYRCETGKTHTMSVFK